MELSRQTCSFPSRPPFSGWLSGRARVFLACLSLATVFHSAARAELQFDVFLGYEGAIREAGWFPMTFEVFNDGPGFNAVIEISSSMISADQLRHVPVELPTNTRKRLTVPMFATSGRAVQWSARLLDERGKLQAERSNLNFSPVAWEGILLASLPRSFAGAPILPEPPQARPDLKPHVARMQVEQFPDNPITLESLNALYLNSEKAISLRVTQAKALVDWIHSGGHLIVAVEQLTDINSTPWLQELLPCELNDIQNVRVDEALQGWLRVESFSASQDSAPERSRRRGPQVAAAVPEAGVPDPEFVNAQMPVATGRLREGAQVLLAAHQTPLIVQGTRGRGLVTVLTFSPERDPVRSWKNRPWFWARAIGIPSDYFSNLEARPGFGGVSVDGVFGAMIDSRQVRKLPVEWLLALLTVYLIVIGPFDQWWLKKINRQMLTWITFPSYVVIFSLLIYFIGYRLRAGDTEWNELHVVDVLPRGRDADLRGRTFASLYSSANQRYRIASDQPFAAFRSELFDLYTANREGSRMRVEQLGHGFRADVSVPVWTSLLYVNDWFETALPPLEASVRQSGGNVRVTLDNYLGKPLQDLHVAVHGRIYPIGSLAAGERKVFQLDDEKSTPLADFVFQHGTGFQHAVEGRRNQFGHNTGQLEANAPHAIAASFTSHLPSHQAHRRFVASPGFDLSPVVNRGQAVVLAWAPDHSPIKPIHEFNPPRKGRNTLLRLAVPVSTSVH